MRFLEGSGKPHDRSDIEIHDRKDHDRRRG
jgi:hypothetical protein